MDVHDLRSLITVLSFVTFMGIVFWAYGNRRKQAFDEAALLPFSDDESPQSPEGKQTSNPHSAAAGEAAGEGKAS